MALLGGYVRDRFLARHSDILESSVVALQTAFANPCPAKLCRAANNLSCSVCPPAVCMLYYEIISETSQTQIK